MCLFCLVSSHLDVAVFFSKQACVRFDVTQPVVGFKCFSLKGLNLGFPVLARQKMRKKMLGFKRFTQVHNSKRVCICICNTYSLYACIT